MTRFLMAGAATLSIMTGVALAQTPGAQTSGVQTPGVQSWGAQSAGQTRVTDETTTIAPSVTVAPPVQAPWTTANSLTTGHAVRADGDQTATAGTSATDSSGNKTETTITNQTYPLTGMITTTKKTTSVVNGIATETVTTTDTYPPSQMRAPTVATTTRTYAVGTKQD